MSAAAGHHSSPGDFIDPAGDDKGSAAGARIDTDGPGRTVLSAGSAFDAAVEVIDFCLLALQGQDPVRAYRCTAAAADTGCRVEFETYLFVDIAKFFHNNIT